MEQTVLLLGQVSNSISYYNRFYMLLALTNSSQQSKQMLREDSELLQKSDKNLFGKKFRENIWHTSKSKKQTLEMLSNTLRTKYKPFRHGHRGVSEGNNNNKSFFSGKERRHSFRKNDTIMATKTAMDTDMININQETLFNKVKFPYVVPVEDLKHIHPYIKSLF